MRTRRLLAVSALSTLALGCTTDKPIDRKSMDRRDTQPLPGNPKGAHYDDAMVIPPVPDAPADAGVVAPRDAASTRPPRD